MSAKEIPLFSPLELAIWDVLEPELEGPLKLDLNELEDNQYFQKLVGRLALAVKEIEGDQHE